MGWRSASSPPRVRALAQARQRGTPSPYLRSSPDPAYDEWPSFRQRSSRSRATRDTVNSSTDIVAPERMSLALRVPVTTLDPSRLAGPCHNHSNSRKMHAHHPRHRQHRARDSACGVGRRACQQESPNLAEPDLVLQTEALEALSRVENVSVVAAWSSR